MKVCLIENCNGKHHGNGYCSKHYNQMKYHGKILERTTKDKNEITIEDNICRMKLYNIKSVEIANTIFDLKFKQDIELYKWHLKEKYVMGHWYDKDESHSMSLHQFIIHLSGQEVPDGYEIDHKDLNGLNNLEANLRICTRAQNQQNRKTLSNNKSGHTGVVWYKQTNRWRAYITYNGMQIHLGFFTTKEDAARAYNIAALKYHGEFAVLNII